MGQYKLKPQVQGSEVLDKARRRTSTSIPTMLEERETFGKTVIQVKSNSSQELHLVTEHLQLARERIDILNIKLPLCQADTKSRFRTKMMEEPKSLRLQENSAMMSMDR